MIDLSNVSKTFTLHNQGSAVIEVLNDVSLTVSPGECVALNLALGLLVIGPDPSDTPMAKK